MIIQNASTESGRTDLTFTVPKSSSGKASTLMQDVSERLGGQQVRTDTHIAKISVVGVGMRSHSGVAAKMFRTLSDKNINIQMISTSEIKISVVIDEDYTELAVRLLHQAFELGDGVG